MTSSETVHGRGETIFTVEDDIDIAALVVEVLHDDGYAPLAFGTSVEALAALDNNPPALILLDLMLPGMDGWAFYSSLRAHPAGGDVPVIIMSAMADLGSIVAGLEMGADDYLTKPFSIDELVARVHVAIRRQRGAAPDPQPAEGG